MTPPHTHLALPALRLPPHCRDGLGAIAAQRLEVTILLPPALVPGDLVELFINDHFARATILTPEHLGQPLQLVVYEAIQRSGMARAHYEVLRAGHARLKSPVTVMLTKLECPGGAPVSANSDENQFLPPLCFPVRQDARTLQGQQGLQFWVPVYPNMAAGDEVTVRWGDVRLDLPPVRVNQVGKPLKGSVPVALLGHVRPAPWQDISWCVTDRVGNHSRWAPAQRVRYRSLCQDADHEPH